MNSNDAMQYFGCRETKFLIKTVTNKVCFVVILDILMKTSYIIDSKDLLQICRINYSAEKLVRKVFVKFFWKTNQVSSEIPFFSYAGISFGISYFPGNLTLQNYILFSFCFCISYSMEEVREGDYIVFDCNGEINLDINSLALFEEIIEFLYKSFCSNSVRIPGNISLILAFVQLFSGI